MVQATLSFLILVPAFVVGMKLIPMYWLAVPAVMAYVKAILSIGEGVPDGDFRNLTSDEFVGSEKAIKVMILGFVVLAGIAFGFGRAVEWLFM